MILGEYNVNVYVFVPIVFLYSVSVYVFIPLSLLI